MSKLAVLVLFMEHIVFKSVAYKTIQNYGDKIMLPNFDEPVGHKYKITKKSVCASVRFVV